jgi:hypothetical protein
MALVIKDRVKETTTTTGTGTLTLAGAASGFQSFAAIGNANTTYYAITDSATGDWEVGLGTYTASGTTLSRDTILASSNSGSAVSLAAGSKNVFATYPAGKAAFFDDIPTNNNQLTNGAGYITGNQTITLSGDVSGSGTTSIAVTVADDSHNHVISNVDGLQTALDAKQAAATALTTSTTFGGDVSGTYNSIAVTNDSHTHDTRYYTETEIGNFFSGTTAITGYSKTNWDTAYTWGNHASAGYLTGNQTITLSGDATGSGTTAITVTVANDSHSHTTTTLSGNVSAFTNDSGYVTSSGVTSVATSGGLTGGTITSTGTISISSDARPNANQYFGGSGGEYFYYDNTNSLVRGYVNSAEVMRLYSGTTGVHFDGDVIAYSTTISDERLKDNIETVEGSIEKLKQIRGVTFTRKHNGEKSAGVVAQEIEKVLPEAVKEKTLGLQTGDEETLYKVVEYDALHALLIEAIKELTDRVEELEAQVG